MDFHKSHHHLNEDFVKMEYVIHDDQHDNFCHYSDSDDESSWTRENDKYTKPCGEKCVVQKVRNPDGTVKLRNPHLENYQHDFLYHLALDTGNHDLVEMFGDIKFVCMGGTPSRMENFAHYIQKEIGYKLPTGAILEDISRKSNRYCMYKVGTVLSISHGMGTSSLTILLHEVLKLMYHAKVKDPIFFRLGTSGGVGVEPGTVVVTNGALDGMLSDMYDLPILGKLVRRPAKFDQKLVKDLLDLASDEAQYKTVPGKTMCCYDFYEGQARLDGAFCEYSEEEKFAFLRKIRDLGVVNIEMEATPFGALTHHAGIKASIVCVTLLDRMQGDQVSTPKAILREYESRPQKLVAKYIKRYLNKKARVSSSPNGSV